MVTDREIEATAKELDVHTSNVQRDYVFGWLLAGIYQPENPLSNHLILKGGNGFRKAYFESTRFSNDIDFSTQTEVDEQLIGNGLKQACGFAEQRSGVNFFPDQNRVVAHKGATDESNFYEARVYFKSFYGEENFTIKVKLDVKEFDRIILPIQTRNLIHAYSDASACQASVRCIKLEELLAQKLTALLHRQHSPDLYDFIYSNFFQKDLDVSRLEVITTFLKRTIYERDPTVVKRLFLQLPLRIFREFWKKYLVCPKASIIDFDDAETQFFSIIEALFALLVPQYGVSHPRGYISLSHFPANLRNLIMEAARSTRILNMNYDNLSRMVEPYALAYKRRQDGVAREYFYAWDLSGGSSGHRGIKSFVADKLRSLEITDTTFKPRYPIELTKSAGYFARPFSSGKSTTSLSTVEYRYTVECPYCSKRFRRKKMNTKLNAHKDQYGNKCYGRRGHMV